MKKMQLFLSVLAGAALLSTEACISSKPPLAISRSTYSSIPKEEHQTIPEGIKFLSLAQAQNIAVQNNPDFKSKYFAIVGARAQYYASFSSYLPTVNATYNIGQQYTKYPNGVLGNDGLNFTSTPGLNVNLTVFDSLAREMKILAAKHNWMSTEQAERDARRLLLFSVATSFNQVLLSVAEINIAVADMNYNRDLLKETELKFAVGASPLSDVLNFKVKYNSAEGNLYTAQNSYLVSKYALATLMGLTQGTIPDDVQFPDTPSPDGEMLADVNLYLNMALETRPDLKKVREMLEVQKYSYYASISAFGPTITFNTQLGYTYGSYKNYGSGKTSWGDTFNASYGGAVNWEIFSGGRTYFAMRQAQAALVQTDYQLASTWLSVIQDVRTAYDNYLTSLKQVKLNQKNVEIVTKMRDLVNEEYLAGSTSITRLNEAQRDLVDAETALANAIINMHNAKAQLQSATNAI